MPPSYYRLQMAAETLRVTEEVGGDTLSALQTQRETLQRARQNMKQTGEEIGAARRFLNRMTARLGLCGIAKTGF